MVKQLFFTLCWALVLFQMSSCTIGKEISEKKFEATDPNKVELYYTKIPNRDYDEIAFVEARTYHGLKINAARIGANAVLHVHLQYNRAFCEGVAVRWK